MDPYHLKKFAVGLWVAVLLFMVAVLGKEQRSWETLQAVLGLAEAGGDGMNWLPKGNA